MELEQEKAARQKAASERDAEHERAETLLSNVARLNEALEAETGARKKKEAEHAQAAARARALSAAATGDADGQLKLLHAQVCPLFLSSRRAR